MTKRVFCLLLVLGLLLSTVPAALAVEDPMKETYTYTDSRGNEVVVPKNAFATRVVSFTAGDPWTKDQDHVNPENILGTPDQGENLCLGKKGQIVLEFSVDIVDNEGMDIYVFEVGPDVEPTQVEVSADGKEWIDVGRADGSLSGVDLNGKVPEGARYHYVRITDLGKYPYSDHPGADIVAVAGLNVKANPFKDLPPDAYYYVPVTWAYDNEITNGVGDDLFDPDATCKRQDVVTYLWRLNGKPEPKVSGEEIPFNDVDLNTYYGKPLRWAYENQVVNGKAADRFAPLDQIKRCEFVALLYRNMGKPQVNIDNPFVDLVEGEYYVDAVLWAYENGITKGMDETHFDPLANCTRAQVVTFLYRYHLLEQQEKPEGPNGPGQIGEDVDLLAYLYRDLAQSAGELGLEALEDGKGYSNGTVTMASAQWTEDTQYVGYVKLVGNHGGNLAGLKVGMSVQEARDLLAGMNCTPVDDTQKDWDNGDGVVITIEGDTTVVSLTAVCY